MGRVWFPEAAFSRAWRFQGTLEADCVKLETTEDIYLHQRGKIC
jgi:hypothetical protein